jgi:hypothetical protein
MDIPFVEGETVAEGVGNAPTSARRSFASRSSFQIVPPTRFAITRQPPRPNQAKASARPPRAAMRVFGAREFLHTQHLSGRMGWKAKQIRFMAGLSGAGAESSRRWNGPAERTPDDRQ